MGVSFSWRPGQGNTGTIVHGRGRANALPIMVLRLAGEEVWEASGTGGQWSRQETRRNTLLPCCEKKWRIMCQKASKRLHREVTEASSRPVLIYFDSCANSSFNYLLLRLEKHLKRTSSRGSRLQKPKSCDCWRCCCRLQPHPLTRVIVFAVCGFVSAGYTRTGFFFFLLFPKVAKQVSRVVLESEMNSACATVEVPRVSLRVRELYVVCSSEQKSNNGAVILSSM